MKKINQTKNEKKANFTINKIFEEMKYAEEYLKKLNVSWLEYCTDVYSMDLYYLHREDHRKVMDLEKKYFNQYHLVDRSMDIRSGQPLKRVTLYDEDNNDYNCEFGIVKWSSSNKTKRDFTFQNNGDIKYSQQSSNKQKSTKINYNAKYNVNSNNLFISFNIDNNKLEATFNDNIIYITYNNLTIEDDLTRGSKKISYKDKQNNREIYYEIIIGADNNIIKKYLKITNYGYNNQVNSTYEFKFKKHELTEAIYLKDEEQIDMLRQEELTELANNLLEKFSNNYPIFIASKEEQHELINSVKDNLFKTIKLIKGDVPLQGLSRRLDIALSMIYAKKEPIIEKSTPKIEEKKGQTKTRKKENKRNKR